MKLAVLTPLLSVFVCSHVVLAQAPATGRQREIYGGVLDATTGQPLEQAHVSMAGRPGEAYSNASGIFVLVTDSVTHLIVGKPGYETRSVDVTLRDTTQVWLYESLAGSDQLITVVEVPAEFPGGMGKFFVFIAQNMRYPREARRAGQQGKVFVEFVIDKNGEVLDVRVLKGISKSLDEEAVRVISKSPNWIPGTQRGKPVKQRMVLPLTFSLGK